MSTALRHAGRDRTEMPLIPFLLAVAVLASFEILTPNISLSAGTGE